MPSESKGSFFTISFSSWVESDRTIRKYEDKRWSDAGFDALGEGQRLLLWHGSRSTNFAGILSQGLRIAPPEAPVNG